MQPNSNRPVYIVQPSSNITSLNVRPTIITTGGQQLQTQQTPTYPISTIRQPTMSPQTTTIYQPSTQTRFVSASPISTTTLQAQQFITSPQQIITADAKLSPRLITPQTTTLLPMVKPQPTIPVTTILRPTLTTVKTSPTIPISTPTPVPPATTTTTAPAQTQAAASNSKDYAVRVSKTRAQYGIMEFTSGLSVDVKDWKAIEMKREINPYTYRPPTAVDPNASTTSITTSLGAVIPKTGAGSEYGREEKEALKRKRYATKGTNVEDLPWILTDRSSTEKKLKHYRGLKKGGVTTNSSYYVFIQGKDGFEAYPVEDWYGFTPTNVYKTLDFEEAEKQYQERHKHLSKWFLKHQVAKEKEDGDADNEDEKGKKSANKHKRGFKLLDTEDWINENEDDLNDDERDLEDDDKPNKKSKTSKTTDEKQAGGWLLSDEEDEETTNTKSKPKTKKTTERQISEEQEDSDDGDHECDEIDYTSDETSEEEEDVKGGHTDKTSSKYEVKGIEEEGKVMPDVKKIEEWDENAGDIDFDDDDEDDLELEDNDDEPGKAAVDDLSEVGKLRDAVSKDMESSSDDDDLDDSDDPDKEPMEPVASSTNTQPNPSEQIKTEKGHKKAREEEMRAIKSKVMSLPTTPANPSETITEEKVRNLLSRKQFMTSKELIQHFLPKTESLRTKEIKEGIVQKLAAILKRLNIEEKNINGKKYMKLKTN